MDRSRDHGKVRTFLASRRASLIAREVLAANLDCQVQK
jgi:hypothetical protein